MERDRPSQPPLLGVPLPVQLRRVGDRLVAELAPEGQMLISSAIQVAAADQAFGFCHAWAYSFSTQWEAQIQAFFVNRWTPGDEATRSSEELLEELLNERASRIAHLCRSALETLTREQEVLLEALRNKHMSRVREAVAFEHTLTSEELEADQALCALLEINPHDVPDDHLGELRKLWA